MVVMVIFGGDDRRSWLEVGVNVINDDIVEILLVQWLEFVTLTGSGSGKGKWQCGDLYLILVILLKIWWCFLVLVVISYFDGGVFLFDSGDILLVVGGAGFV